jgi:hypothetical protein
MTASESGATTVRGVSRAVVIRTRGRISLQGMPRRDCSAAAGSRSVDVVSASYVPFTLDASSGHGIGQSHRGDRAGFRVENGRWSVPSRGRSGDEGD